MIIFEIFKHKTCLNIIRKSEKFEIIFESLSKLEQLRIAIDFCQPKTLYGYLMMDMEQLELEHSTVCKLVPIHHLV